MQIIGAGMAGLIAYHYFRKYAPVIIEKQKALPNNHEALLRFRTNDVSNVTGIPFKKVLVRKNIWHNDEVYQQCCIMVANMYSLQVTGTVSQRSIWNLDAVERYIAPGDLIPLMGNRAPIRFGSEFVSGVDDSAIISTMPMPKLMDLVSWKNRPRFDWRPIWSIQGKIESPVTDVYQTYYVVTGKPGVYRVSLSGNIIIIESTLEPKNVDVEIDKALNALGISCFSPISISDIKTKYQEYGKIVDADRSICEEFIYTMTREHNIYSLGRFATWRQILLDDVVQDCRVIERLINAETKRQSYHLSLEKARQDLAP